MTSPLHGSATAASGHYPAYYSPCYGAATAAPGYFPAYDSELLRAVQFFVATGDHVSAVNASHFAARDCAGDPLAVFQLYRVRNLLSSALRSG